MKLMYGNKAFFVIAILSTSLTAVFRLGQPKIITATIDSVLGNEPLEAGSLIGWFVEKLGGLDYIKERIWICAVLTNR